MQSSVKTKTTQRSIYTIKKTYEHYRSQSTDISCPNWGIDNVASYDKTVLKLERKPSHIDSVDKGIMEYCEQEQYRGN